MYGGNAIWPHNEDGLENLARYIIRASFSQERMTYVAAQDSLDGIAKVIYESKDGKSFIKFEALEWLTQLTTHISSKSRKGLVSILNINCYYLKRRRYHENSNLLR